MFENIRLSFQGIFSHKMRSFLTMLGIIIGIAAIIAIVSTIKGTNDQIRENLIGSGNNVVKVSLNQSGMEVLPSDTAVPGAPIVDEDMLSEIQKMDGVRKAVRYHKAENYNSIRCGNNTLEGSVIIGGTNDYLEIEGYQLTGGRELAARDFDRFRNVCILDDSTAYSLFQGKDPVGGTIEISDVPFVVVGTVEQKEEFEPVINTPAEWETYYSDNSSAFILVPDTSWPSIYTYDEPYNLLVQATGTEEMTRVGKEVQDYLNGFFQNQTPEGQSDSAIRYKSEDTLEKAKELQKLSSSTNQQLIWIASISLLVGGIGVMNIMLVSVTERTREIGLKKALGAPKKAILGQFLTEAAVLTSIGGILGVGAGIGLSYLIAKVAEVPVAISVPAIVVSVVFSMLIGIIFGLIPSVKAANLNPIDSLRYE